MDMLIIKKLLEPFGLTLGQLQDISTLLGVFKKNNISIDDFAGFIKNERLELIKSNESDIKRIKKNKTFWGKNALRCSECSQKMNLYPVNTVPGDKTGDDSKSVWICPNKNCMETIYNKQSMQEITEGGS